MIYTGHQTGTFYYRSLPEPSSWKVLRRHRWSRHCRRRCRRCSSNRRRRLTKTQSSRRQRHRDHRPVKKAIMVGQSMGRKSDDQRKYKSKQSTWYWYKSNWFFTKSSTSSTSSRTVASSLMTTSDTSWSTSGNQKSRHKWEELTDDLLDEKKMVFWRSSLTSAFVMLSLKGHRLVLFILSWKFFVSLQNAAAYRRNP